MAGFHTKTFKIDDQYMTPKYAWENITQFIPKDKVIWEAFYGDGKSAEYLRELGCKEVIHQDRDFFISQPDYDVLISNPPFSIAKTIMPKLKELDKPFILIMPSSKICTSYFRENFKNSKSELQIIIPRKRIHFIKNGDKSLNKCNFDCFYYAYKMNLPRDIVWLED